MTKSDLRNVVLAKQRSLSAAERFSKSQAIADRFFETIDLDAIKLLHCFIPIDRFNEVDTLLIFHRIWKDFPLIQTVVPCIQFDTGSMENVRFSSKTDLVENKWGIREPDITEPVASDKIDLVLVPLLCFDSDGHRVGYGKGFYDRFLIRCRPDCLKIGLSYFQPVERIEDAGEHDMKLNLCVTPERIFG
ncbi:MAG: 5-formyltetrahydrofolate cyclo-ligase [Pyrinomonadaceae bacterium]